MQVSEFKESICDIFDFKMATIFKMKMTTIFLKKNIPKLKCLQFSSNIDHKGV